MLNLLHMSERGEPPIEISPNTEIEVVKKTDALDTAQRLWRITQDPQVREGFIAALRTLTNAGIAFGEMVPYLGQIGSLSADLGKIITRISGGKINLDLTPDVSLSKALLTEALDFIPGLSLLIPTHAIETLSQLQHDLPRLQEAARRIQAIWDGREHELGSPEVLEAMVTFDDSD